MHSIETTRLVLRPLAISDAAALHVVVGNDPDMTWDHTSRSLEYVTHTVSDRIEHYRANSFGVLGVVRKDTGELIGQCGLQKLPGSEEIEMVVYTAKKYWRRGYGAEACTAMLKYGFEWLHAQRIVWITRVENQPALTLARKLGFRYVRNDQIYYADVAVFEMASSEFLGDRLAIKVTAVE